MIPEDETLPLVSVIVPVHNDAHRLSACLAAVHANDYPWERLDVVVVDDASTDDPSGTCADFGAACIRRPSRGGSYAARNAGIEHSKGTIVALTDADCIPTAQWLCAGVRALTDHPEWGAVAGPVRVFFRNGAPRSMFELYDAVSAFPQKDYVQSGHWAATANLLVRREALRFVGAFDESLESGGDKEWGQRAFSMGVTIGFDPKMDVLHPARERWAQLCAKERRVAKGLLAIARNRAGFSVARPRHATRTVLKAAVRGLALARSPGLTFAQRVGVFALHLQLRAFRAWLLAKG